MDLCVLAACRDVVMACFTTGNDGKGSPKGERPYEEVCVVRWTLVSAANGHMPSKTCGKGLIPAIAGSITVLLASFAAALPSSRGPVCAACSDATAAAFGRMSGAGERSFSGLERASSSARSIKPCFASIKTGERLK